MQPTQTGIAVAIALALVAVIFVVPGLWPFGVSAPTEQGAQDGVVAGLSQQPAQAQAALPTQTPTMQQPQNVTELSIKDEVVGSGPAAKAGDEITVNYVGSLLNGKVFDASANHGTSGFTFVLGRQQVIAGWDQGLVGMKVGGKRLLVIPANMAYGNRAIGDVIPANSPLIFEVELLKIGK